KTSITEVFRQKLATKAFYHLSFYDSQIARFFNKDLFPQELSLALRKKVNLRYGENPHQKASLYMYPNNNSPLNNLKRQWGRELSLVNVTDINAGLESLRFFRQAAAVVIKHNSPCGIALGKTAKEALARAIEADPESAFGGIIVINKNMDLATAKIIGDFKDLRRSNIDIVAIPKINKNTLEYLKKIRKSMGIYTFGKIYQKRKYQENIKWVNGGLVIQTEDNRLENGFKNWKTVTKIKPTEKQLTLMKIAWKFIARIHSNAVIIVDKNLPMTRGIGSGQTSRVRSTKIALEQAGKYAKGAILASDSFFPFDDSIKLAAKKGIIAIVQQGGSINDKMSIDTADKYKMAMVFTNRRAFWH
ncbi:MAG: bifunctional phosphoribosylaminoimidazolecarboxamide formyltransferase/IMP cyclohydrolase, partial [Patescibacteria group bacterium]